MTEDQLEQETLGLPHVLAAVWERVKMTIEHGFC